MWYLFIFFLPKSTYLHFELINYQILLNWVLSAVLFKIKTKFTQNTSYCLNDEVSLKKKSITAYFLYPNLYTTLIIKDNVYFQITVFSLSKANQGENNAENWFQKCLTGVFNKSTDNLTKGKTKIT